MAQHQKPLTDEELAEFREAMEEQDAEVREALADDLGGDPADYRVENHPTSESGDTGEAVTDGGDST